MSENSSKEGDYLLARGVAASVRLNLQHYIWKEHVGYLLHSSIPVDKENLMVAEIGTGTGIWLAELAPTLPSTAQLHGFDIDTTQYPPREWLLPNVSMYQLDALKPIPEHLIGQYDVVHVRHMILVIKDSEIAPALLNLMKMIKPGGFIQWGEYDLPKRKVVRARSSNSTDNVVALQKFITGAVKTPFWATKLETIFKANGLEEVTADCHPTTPSHYTYQHDLILMTYDELTRAFLDRLGEKEGMHGRELLVKAVEESREGVTWTMDRITVVGRKPS